MSEKELKRLRREINRIDAGILSLLHRRMKISARIGERKRKLGLPPYDPVREREILTRLKSRHSGPLSAPGIDLVFGEILSACRSAFRPIRVAYARPEQSPGHAAGVFNFGRSVRFRACPGKSGVYRALQTGRADYGMITAPSKKPGFPPGLIVVKKGIFPGRSGKKGKYIVLQARGG
jgi:chorismate mutase/prephenate dehydratase